MRSLLLLLVLLLAGCGRSGPAPAPKGGAAPAGTYTLEQFKQVQPGMTYEQVARIMGTEGVPIGSSGSGGVKTETFDWANQGGGSMGVTFQDGIVVGKAQARLR